MRSLAKTRPSPLVVETEVTISRGAFWVLSTVAPPSGKQQQQQQQCINANHAAGRLPDATTWSDTRAAAGLKPSCAPRVTVRLGGSITSIGIGELSSAGLHRNQDHRHRNVVGLLLMKTHFPHHRSNSWMTNSRATYKMPFVTTGGVYAHMWPKDPCRRGITTG